MNRITILIALTLALAFMGCSDKKKKKRRAQAAPAATAAPGVEGAAATAGTAPTETVPTAVEAAAPAPAEPEAAPSLSVEGVPDYENKSVPSKVVTQSQKHNSKAVKHHIKKRYDKAALEYIKALTLNPRYEFARYNLACAYALMGQDDKALGLLKQMKAVGTWKSLERVQKSKKDKDFRALHNDPRFIAITEDVHVEDPNYKMATIRLGKYFKAKKFQPTFDDGRAVRIVRSYYPTINADGMKGNRLKSEFFDVNTVRQLHHRLKKWFPFPAEWDPEDIEESDSPWHIWPALGADANWKCKKNCCKTENCGDHCCPGSMSPAPLKEVCFWPLSTDKLLPIKITFFHCE